MYSDIRSGLATQAAALFSPDKPGEGEYFSQKEKIHE